jgi:hypothetical protein
MNANQNDSLALVWPRAHGTTPTTRLTINLKRRLRGLHVNDGTRVCFVVVGGLVFLLVAR